MGYNNISEKSSSVLIYFDGTAFHKQSSKGLKCVEKGGGRMEKENGSFNFKSPLLFFVIVWSIIWKGIALWHAARNRQLPWFLSLLIVNTVGLVEIMYLIFFRKDRQLDE